MEHRLLGGKRDADGFGEVVAFDLGFGHLERPGNMVDVGANELAGAVAGEEAVALREEVFEGAAAVFGQLARGAKAPVPGAEDDRLAGKRLRLKNENSRSERCSRRISAQ